jgi:hypothetical protein
LVSVLLVIATPVLMVTRLFTVLNALARPTLFVLDVPKLSVLAPPNVGVKNCPIANAAAAVVTSLIVMKVLEVRFPHCPSGAISLIELLSEPKPGFPPVAVIYTSELAVGHV